jgi:hypothetical protein
VLHAGVIASNGVNGSPRSEQVPKGTGIQVLLWTNWPAADPALLKLLLHAGKPKQH